jgi:hypothetical protein
LSKEKDPKERTPLDLQTRQHEVLPGLFPVHRKTNGRCATRGLIPFVLRLLGGVERGVEEPYSKSLYTI